MHTKHTYKHTQIHTYKNTNINTYINAHRSHEHAQHTYHAYTHISCKHTIHTKTHNHTKHTHTHKFKCLKKSFYFVMSCGPKQVRFVWGIGGEVPYDESLTSESVEGTSLAFKSIDDIHGGDSLPLGMLGVGDGITMTFSRKTFRIPRVSSQMRPEMRLTPPRRAIRRMAGLVIPSSEQVCQVLQNMLYDV